ncbi:hypothetical protein CK203_032442 [Vitis vinifera]|uniref:Uncharacterized protein n=1 Tax=Vitis vinifera TaxID=29760 RepID=A0A438I6R6_VITVI|nr:hypothetical protein CK203_032442 [Vitis vinifera]
MTLTRAFEKLRDGGLMVPLVPCHLPHPIPSHFRSHEHCLYHQIQGHDTERCLALHHAIQDLIDSGIFQVEDLVQSTWTHHFAVVHFRAPFILIMVVIRVVFVLMSPVFSSSDSSLLC